MDEVNSPVDVEGGVPLHHRQRVLEERNLDICGPLCRNPRAFGQLGSSRRLVAGLARRGISEKSHRKGRGSPIFKPHTRRRVDLGKSKNQVEVWQPV